MRADPRAFPDNAREALADSALAAALARSRDGFINKRLKAVNAVPEFDALKRQAEAIRTRSLQNLDNLLQEYEQAAAARGVQVHWAEDAAAARRCILDICKAAGARRVTKGKSMVTEEISLNPALEQAGMEVTETDLGEYIIQLRGERPSHIIAPAVHLSRGQIAETFRAQHHGLDPERALETPEDLIGEARGILRNRYQAADVGITGANFLIAETGQGVIVTNEGNGDLTRSAARVHIAVAGLEKVTGTLEETMTLLRVLARSATGQAFSTYTTFFGGPDEGGETGGPEESHVVLLDNGRSRILAGAVREILRCIRCGACMNHCPVYGAIGGHAYGWVYPGPMGAVLTPALLGVGQARHLPEASSFCGRCAEVCPVGIPLPDLMRKHREEAFRARAGGPAARLALHLWAFLALRPKLYHRVTRVAARLLARLGGRRGRFRYLPLAGGWTAARDFPAPQGPTFQSLWQQQRGNGAHD